jgi:hypothetical protein
VAGGQAAGLAGILVGDHRDPAVEPDQIITNLAGLLEPAA